MSAYDPKETLDGARLVSSNSRLPLLFSALIFSLTFGIYASKADELVDYAPIMARGFGVHDEPSILEQCGGDFFNLLMSALPPKPDIKLILT